MTQTVTVKWAAAISGSYATGADWTPSGIPTDTAAFDYFLYIGGSYSTGTSAFTVTTSANETVGFLEIGANATFAVASARFALDSFLHPGSNLYNYGAFTVAAGAVLSFGDTKGTESTSGGLWNNGTVAVSGVLQVEAPDVGLYGAGVLTLSGRIIGTTSLPQTFVNRSTIVGAGVIGGNADLAFVNKNVGVVNANTSAVMTLNTGANQIDNAGTIETTGAGGLTILSNVQSDGHLLDTGTGILRITSAEVHGAGDFTIGAGATTYINNGELSFAGVITIAKTGKLVNISGNLSGIGPGNAYVGDVLNGGDVEDDGAVYVSANSLLNLNGTVYGAGALYLEGATGSPSTLEIFGDGVNFQQAGGIILSNSVQNNIVSNGAGVQATNQTTIKGAGMIGDGWLRIFNSRAGTILADDSASLTIVADAQAILAGTEKENYNDGAITNTGAGGLVIGHGTLDNAGTITEDGVGALTLIQLAIDSGGGDVQITAGDFVLSQNSSIVSQAGVKLAAAGVLTTTAGDTADELYSGVTNAGQIDVVAGSVLDAEGHWVNTSQIVVGSATAGATLAVEANATLELLGSGGSLRLAEVGDKIVSGGAGALLENKTNLIEGAGTIGDANLTIVNDVDGVINANGSGGLILNARVESGTTSYITNAGIIEATTGAGVKIAAGIYNPGQLIANSGSKIIASSDVDGAGTATINGVSSIEFGAHVQNDVYFGASVGGKAIFDHSAEFSGDIFGLKVSDSFDLRDFNFIANETGISSTLSSFGDAAATIVLVAGTTTSATIHLEGKYTLSEFQVVADGAASNGSLVKLVS
jgi:hypothetical protein